MYARAPSIGVKACRGQALSSFHPPGKEETCLRGSMVEVVNFFFHCRRMDQRIVTANPFLCITTVLFISSTVLDKWTWEQLRAMTLGGNAAAKEHFNKYPGSDSKDVKTKYSGKAGIAYKEKLAQKVKEDMLMYVLTAIFMLHLCFHVLVR